MSAGNVVPTEPLNISHVSTGFLPSVALHRRDSEWHHESSFAHFWFFGAMCVTALGTCCVPWDARAVFEIPVRYFIAAGCVWGGVCGLTPYFIRNRIGQRLVIDTNTRVITIHRRDTSKLVAEILSNPVSILTADPLALPTQTICFSDVLGVQLSGEGPFQANLVYHQGNDVLRHNLINDGTKSFAESLAAAYSNAGGFELLDHS